MQFDHVAVARDLGQDRGGHDRAVAGIAADQRFGAARQAARQRVAVDARDVGGVRDAVDARRMPGIVAWKMLRRSISSTSTNTTCQASARSTMRSIQHFAARGGELLGIVQPVDRRAAGSEDHRCHDHRTGERPTTGFVDAGDAQQSGVSRSPGRPNWSWPTSSRMRAPPAIRRSHRPRARRHRGATAGAVRESAAARPGPRPDRATSAAPRPTACPASQSCCISSGTIRSPANTLGSE